MNNNKIKLSKDAIISQQMISIRKLDEDRKKLRKELVTLREENERYRKALEFYGDKTNWDTDFDDYYLEQIFILEEKWEVAKEALSDFDQK